MHLQCAVCSRYYCVEWGLEGWKRVIYVQRHIHSNIYTHTLTEPRHMSITELW